MLVLTCLSLISLALAAGVLPTDEEVDAALRRLARRGLITFDERFGWNAETDAPFGAT